MLFTKQELKVMKLLAEGKTQAEIAAELGISYGTVGTYRRRINFALNARGIMVSDLKGIAPDLLEKWIEKVMP